MLIQTPNAQIATAARLAEELRGLADSSIDCCEDEGCLMLNGLIRDCAFKILNSATSERQVHEENGTWDFPSADEVGTVNPDRRG